MTKIRTRINYSLDKLNNKQSLFSVDPDLLKTPLTVTQSKEEEQPNVNSDIPPDEGQSVGNGEPLVQRVRHLTQKRRNTVSVGLGQNWFIQYSSLNIELIHRNSILTHQNTNSFIASSVRDSSEINGASKVSKIYSNLMSIEANYLQNLELFRDTMTLSFDIFDFQATVGRSNALTLLNLHLLRQLPG